MIQNRALAGPEGLFQGRDEARAQTREDKGMSWK